MQEKRIRFGDFIRQVRLRDSRELRQADVANELGLSLSFYSDIENRRKRPFAPEKMEIFAELFDLPDDKKAQMYDLASRENREVPADIEDIFMYEEIGDLARVALRQSKAGDITEADWKRLIREGEANKARRKGELQKNDKDED